MSVSALHFAKQIGEAENRLPDMSHTHFKTEFALQAQNDVTFKMDHTQEQSTSRRFLHLSFKIPSYSFL